MNTSSPVSNAPSRLFEHFIDPIDMIACFPADTRLREVNQIVSDHDLYFPLYCDPDRSLREHINAMEYTPASARFGAYVDNIPGMNWTLPTGQVARIGERVVKSTTGYDLLRYLLHSKQGFGSARDYVIRLRPKSPESYHFTIHGSADALQTIAQSIIQSTWSHWIDCCDRLTFKEQTQLQISGRCLTGESIKFQQFFESLTFPNDAQLAVDSSGTNSPIPAFIVKTVPSQTNEIAQQCIHTLGGHTRTLLVNGVVLAYPETTPTADWLQQIHLSAAQHGGHLHHVDSAAPISNPKEASWVESILHSWKQI